MKRYSGAKDMAREDKTTKETLDNPAEILDKTQERVI